MDVVGLPWGGVGAVMREAALFAAAGFLLLGAGDLAVDLLWLLLRVSRRVRQPRREPEPTKGQADPRLVLFVPAWDEAAVIAPMIRATLAAYRCPDVRLYLGCYPNDRATAAAAGTIDDPRLRIVVGAVPGPTTKADCLNTLWRALIADEAAGIM
jgi:adsorption protein B